MIVRPTRPSRLAAFLARWAPGARTPLRRLAQRWRAWRREVHDLAQIELLDASALRDLGAGWSTRDALRSMRR